MVVTHRNIDKLIDRFIENGNVYYTVNTSGGIHNKNEEAIDIDEAAERLKRFFKETEGSEATYIVSTFKVLPKGGLKKNSEADVVLTFKHQRYSDEQKAEYTQNRSYFYEKQRDEIQMLKNEIDLLKAVNTSADDEEVEAEVESVGIIGQVQAILEIPQVQMITNALIGAITNKFLNTNTNKPMTLAGTEAQAAPQTVTLEQIIQTLMNKGVTIEHLYKLSQFDEAKIKMLLTML